MIHDEGTTTALGFPIIDRTIAFILLPFIFCLSLTALSAELVARLLPNEHQSPNAYQRLDAELGFSSIPSRSCRIASVAKGFDIEVRVDEDGNTLIVLWINPINDLVNLTSQVDYHFAKPHAVLESGELVFRPAMDNASAIPFLVSDPFDS